MGGVCFFFVCFCAKPGSAQELLLTLHSVITLDYAQGTIYGTSDGTQLSLMKDKCLTDYTVTAVPDLFIYFFVCLL